MDREGGSDVESLRLGALEIFQRAADGRLPLPGAFRLWFACGGDLDVICGVPAQTICAIINRGVQANSLPLCTIGTAYAFITALNAEMVHGLYPIDWPFRVASLLRTAVIQPARRTASETLGLLDTRAEGKPPTLHRTALKDSTVPVVPESAGSDETAPPGKQASESCVGADAEAVGVETEIHEDVAAAAGGLLAAFSGREALLWQSLREKYDREAAVASGVDGGLAVIASSGQFDPAVQAELETVLAAATVQYGSNSAHADIFRGFTTTAAIGTLYTGHEDSLRGLRRGMPEAPISVFGTGHETYMNSAVPTAPALVAHGLDRSPRPSSDAASKADAAPARDHTTAPPSPVPPAHQKASLRHGAAPASHGSSSVGGGAAQLPSGTDAATSGDPRSSGAWPAIDCTNSMAFNPHHTESGKVPPAALDESRSVPDAWQDSRTGSHEQPARPHHRWQEQESPTSKFLPHAAVEEGHMRHHEQQLRAYRDELLVLQRRCRQLEAARHAQQLREQQLVFEHERALQRERDAHQLQLQRLELEHQRALHAQQAAHEREQHQAAVRAAAGELELKEAHGAYRNLQRAHAAALEGARAMATHVNAATADLTTRAERAEAEAARLAAANQKQKAWMRALEAGHSGGSTRAGGDDAYRAPRRGPPPLAPFASQRAEPEPACSPSRAHSPRQPFGTQHQRHHLRAMLVQFFQRHDPAQVADVDAVLAQWAGREAELERLVLIEPVRVGE